MYTMMIVGSVWLKKAQQDLFEFELTFGAQGSRKLYMISELPGKLSLSEEMLPGIPHTTTLTVGRGTVDLSLKIPALAP